MDQTLAAASLRHRTGEWGKPLHVASMFRWRIHHVDQLGAESIALLGDPFLLKPIMLGEHQVELLITSALRAAASRSRRSRLEL
jgi:hypothetical protein